MSMYDDEVVLFCFVFSINVDLCTSKAWGRNKRLYGGLVLAHPCIAWPTKHCTQDTLMCEVK